MRLSAAKCVSMAVVMLERIWEGEERSHVAQAMREAWGERWVSAVCLRPEALMSRR